MHAIFSLLKYLANNNELSVLCLYIFVQVIWFCFEVQYNNLVGRIVIVATIVYLISLFNWYWSFYEEDGGNKFFSTVFLLFKRIIMNNKPSKCK